MEGTKKWKESTCTIDERNNEGKEKRKEKDGQREAKLSGRSQRYVRRVLLSGIKKRFVIRPKIKRERERAFTSWPRVTLVAGFALGGNFVRDEERGWW